jgi:hypothetical protein
MSEQVCLQVNSVDIYFIQRNFNTIILVQRMKYGNRVGRGGGCTQNKGTFYPKTSDTYIIYETQKKLLMWIEERIFEILLICSQESSVFCTDM